MSLQVWLPLNGDLHNQGLSDIIITNNGATIDNNGKIGKCYFFNSNYIKITNLSIPINTWSLTAWAYPQADTSSGHQYIVGLNTSSASDFLGVLCFYQNKFGVRTAGTTYSSPNTSALNNWYHICATYNGINLKLYVNGVLVLTKSSPATPKAASTCYIGTRGGITGNFHGKINDVRIYDHCLSDKEVEEIAKGLVLHYKLDNNGLGNPNILTKSSLKSKIGNFPSVNNQYVQTFENIDGYDCFHIHSDTFGVSTSLGWQVYTTINSYPIGTKFTLSGWIKTENIQKGTTNYFASLYYGGSYNNNGTSTWIGEGSRIASKPASSSAFDLSGQGWTYCYIVSTFTRNDYTGMSAMYYLRDFKGDIYLRNFKFEVNDKPTPWIPHSSEMIDFNIIYDSSGYNNNGDIVNTLTLNSNSPKYNCSTVFDGTARIIATSLPAETKTLTCWAKTTKNKSTSQQIVADSNSALTISFYNGTIIGVFGTTRNTGSKSTLGPEYKENDWNFFAVVKTSDDGKRDIYCNGIKLTPAANDYWGAATGFFVGARDTSQRNPFYGEISDVRAYATALTAEQILELYNTSVTIDNQGNVYAREVIE